MKMDSLTIIKVGGKIVEEPETLSQLLNDFSKIQGLKILVHGGGRAATKLAEKLGVETQMVNGKRITNKEMLDVVTMVYGGLVNKNIVAQLQSRGINALGLTGADMGSICSHKRPIKDIDYGFVGDVERVNGKQISALLELGILPVFAPLTFDNQGNILNTNADTVAGEIAKEMAKFYNVTLVFCFEKKGVLADVNDENSVITQIDTNTFKDLKGQGIIQDGMIPKLENAFDAIQSGVKQVIITKADAIDKAEGTVIVG
jgi:acetylglutamate kinase